MKKEIRFYNIIFPLWSLIIFPLGRIIVLPANFIIDSLVLIIASLGLKIKHWKTIYKKSIWKVWGFGFLADIVGAGRLFLSNYVYKVRDNGEGASFLSAVNYDPWETPLVLLWTGVGVLISGFLIYFFNARWSFKQTDLSPREKKLLSLTLAIFTSPYLFLVPLRWILKGY